MKKIKLSSSDYKVDSINAIISGNKIISGLSGIDVDYDKSYYNMKKYGVYNESLIVLKNVKPTISIDNNYDKYIIGGNKNNKNISFVFTVKDYDGLDKVLSILNSKNIVSTFFIDGTLFEKYSYKIKNIGKIHEVEVLSYDGDYDEDLFLSSISYLNALKKEKSSFCYSEIDNNKLLNLCSKNKMHTVMPTYHIKKNLYLDIKKNLSNSIICSIDINKSNINELSSTIDYIIYKGFRFVSINDLVNE